MGCAASKQAGKGQKNVQTGQLGERTKVSADKGVGCPRGQARRMGWRAGERGRAGGAPPSISNGFWLELEQLYVRLRMWSFLHVPVWLRLWVFLHLVWLEIWSCLHFHVRLVLLPLCVWQMPSDPDAWLCPMPTQLPVSASARSPSHFGPPSFCGSSYGCFCANCGVGSELDFGTDAM